MRLPILRIRVVIRLYSLIDLALAGESFVFYVALFSLRAYIHEYDLASLGLC